MTQIKFLWGKNLGNTINTNSECNAFVLIKGLIIHYFPVIGLPATFCTALRVLNDYYAQNFYMNAPQHTAIDLLGQRNKPLEINW